jgi:hypothetical protein
MRKPKRATPPRRPPATRSASAGAPYKLLGAEALGGHRARAGFRFQDLWIAFQLLGWVTQDDFLGVVNEGIDDVDACWRHGGRRGAQDPTNPAARDWRIHQLKDTTITPPLLSEILDAFRRKEASFPATWSHYHVVATRCVERLNSLPALLQQTRNYLTTHGRDSAVAVAAVAEFADKLKRLGIGADATFVVDRVELNFTAGWVGDTDTFSRLFNANLAGYGIARERLAEAGRALIALVSGDQVGALLARADVTALLDGFKPKVEGKPVLDATELPLAATQSRRASKAALDEPALISMFPGGAVLLRLPGGAHGLIDCGVDAAPQIIAWLDARKVDTLDFVAVSHWHFDRYGGVLSVLSALKRVRRLLLPSFPGKYRPRLGRKLLDPLETTGPAHFRIGELAVTNARSVIWQLGDDPGAGARVEAYAADMNDPEVVRLAAVGTGLERINDFCTVFRVVVGSRSFLLTADATFPCWDRLFRRLVGPGKSLRADGLTVPHHGNRRALSQDLLAAIAEPSGFYAVVDPAPRWNFPDRQALALLRDGNGEILVCDGAPVHLMLTREGLFERRFALGSPADGARPPADAPRFTIPR